MIHYVIVFVFVFLSIFMLTKYGMDNMDYKMDDLYICVISLLVACIVTYGYYYVSHKSNVPSTETIEAVDAPTTDDVSGDSPEESILNEPANTTSTHMVSHLKSKKPKKPKET